MSAGYIQLAAIGQQDAYLTGSPDITYFAGVYKRHTPFVLEAYDIPFKERVGYGKNNICRIPPKGDLIRALTLKVNLPPLFDPGTYWAYPVRPSTTFQPQICIDGTWFALPITSTYIYYSTINLNGGWLSNSLRQYIKYSSTTNQFLFYNCRTVEVDSTGVFWGLDPKLGTVSNSSNIVYYFTGSTTPANWTLEQAGWVKSIGVPTVNTGTSLFLTLMNRLSVSGFLNFNLLKNQYPTSYYSITPNGRIQFTQTGVFMVRASFYMGDSGSVLTVSYGSDQNESISPDGIPKDPQFEYMCDFRVSPDPSMPLLVPLTVRNVANTYYFFVSTTSSASLDVGSYLTIGPIDDAYTFNRNANIPISSSSVVPLYGNVVAPLNQSVSLGSDHSMTFSSTGTWLLSGVLYVKQPDSGLSANYVSNVSVWRSGSSTPDYEYTLLSLQGRDPTVAFSMPIYVSDTTQKYFTNIYSSSYILRGSYYTITQIGATSYAGLEYVLPKNGILLSANTASPGTVTQWQQLTGSNTPLKFTQSDYRWSLPGLINYSNIISINAATGNLNFSNLATYMLTAVLSCSDNIRSISFGTTTYRFDTVGFPQYTVNIPYTVTQVGQDVPIKIVTDQSGATTNIFSNSYITVYPLSSNEKEPKTYNYHDSVGTWMIQQADLIIGGQTVQTLTGEFIELYNDLYIPYENQSALKLLTGKGDFSQIYPPGRTYYVNLPFYFYQKPELALPISALDRQDVEIHVHFKEFSELSNSYTSTWQTTPLEATIITEYVYLSEPEINWFKKTRVDYIIQQCQYQTFKLASTTHLKLKFINPVKELFFIVQVDGTDPYQYSDLNTLKIIFNSSEACTEDDVYLNCVQPLNNHINYPSRNFYMYSFVSHVNFSRIRDIFITIDTDSPASKQLRVIGMNYNVLSVKDGLAGLMFNSNDY